MSPVTQQVQLKCDASAELKIIPFDINDKHEVSINKIDTSFL